MKSIQQPEPGLMNNRGIDTKKDYYAVLGVLDTAEDVVIQGAYRGLAHRYHPDRFDGSPTEATARMAEINEAYGILSDVDQRAQYDRDRDPFTQAGGSASVSADIAFEVETFRAFAERLRDWGYDEATIRNALTGRGLRLVVAEQLARMVTASIKLG